MDEMDILIHTGVGHDDNPPGRGSGRYAYGSGNRPHQHEWDIYSRIRKYEAEGMTASEIAAAMGYKSTTELKAARQMATNAVKIDIGAEIDYYYHSINPATGKYYTTTEIGRIVGMGESSVRTRYSTYLKGNASLVSDTAETLKQAVAEKGYIDVGRGSELYLGVSPDRLTTSLEMLKKEGYTVATIRIKQVSDSGQETTFKVLAPPGTTEQDIYQNRFNIQILDEDSGTTSALVMKGEHDPVPIDISTVEIRYAEQEGTAKDGMIEIAATVDKDGNLVPVNPALSLGNAKYAQVRIAVNGGEECVTEDNPTGMKYIKGMATYSTNVPDGKDILVNSNKSIEDGPKEALKDLKTSETHPFGSSVVQTEYIDPKTGEKKVSSINVVGTNYDDMHVEGSWGSWSKNLPSQFLAKQSLGLVKQQLNLKAKQSDDQLQDILSLNNPVVKKQLLQSFADQCDSDAVSLKAAPIGGQGIKVILPVTSLKNTECYCPSLEDGTTVALVRFPHAGPFEIPICTVNNRNREAKIFAKDGRDMIGINSNTAAKLSGADFDGDTVIAIPMTRKNASGEFEKTVAIKSAPSLEGLEGFDPTARYSVKNERFSKMVDSKGKPTYHIMTEREKGIEMGVVSNLITDMYARGCDDPKDLADAVRYSMVVIDAKKHKLNYKQAEKDFNIEALKKKYQAHADGSYGGASSILSQSKSEKTVAARAIGYDIDPDTGAKIFRSPRKTTEPDQQRVKVTAPEGYTWTDASGKSHRSKAMKDSNGKDIYATTDGKVVQNKDGSYTYDRGSGKDIWETRGYKARTQRSTKMYETDDARTLLSDTPNEIEKAYADYANHMKTLGNQARKESLRTGTLKTSKEAKQRYSTEVESLKNKLEDARRNAPRERKAQLIARSMVNAAYAENPEMDSDDRKKIRGQAISTAREITGAKRHMVTFTEKEWEAVNNGAVSENFLSQLLDKADTDNYVSLAMPKENRISDSKKARILALYKAGWSYSEIAKAVSGVSISSVANIVAS